MRLWNALEDIPEWSAVRSVWRKHLGEELEFLQPLLRPMDQLALSLPMTFNTEPYRIVHHAEDDIVAVDSETGEAIAVTPDVIVIHKLDADTLLRGIASAFGLAGDPASVGMLNRLWWLGDFVPIEGERFPVYLTTICEIDNLLGSAGIASALTVHPLILITPTRRGRSDPLEQLVRNRRAAWIVLEETLEWKGEGVFAARRPLGKVLSSFLAEHVDRSIVGERTARFATPPGSTWADVKVRFIDGHTVSVAVNGTCAVLTYSDMGMADQRTRQPTVQWELLHAFAVEHGELSWESSAATRKNQKRCERLSRHLEAFFGINADPFEYDDDLKGWRARFSVEPD